MAWIEEAWEEDGVERGSLIPCDVRRWRSCFISTDYKQVVYVSERDPERDSVAHGHAQSGRTVPPHPSKTMTASVREWYRDTHTHTHTHTHIPEYTLI
jgi:hypothetical protein